MTNTIFYVVFCAQIFLLTVFFPMLLLLRIRYIQDKYPESSHPKLYPKSINYYEKTSRVYVGLNALIFCMGWVVVYYIYEGSLVSEKGIHPMLPWLYFMIQMIPTWMVEIFGFRMSKLMKSEDNRTKKSANLAPRTIFQYISAQMLFAVIAVFMAYIGFVFYLESLVPKLSGKAMIMSATLLFVYVLFFGLSLWLIKGKKCDPYQTQEDRAKAVSTVIKTYCFTAIACAVFMAFSIAVSSFGMKSMMPVAMSLFLQFIVLVSQGYVFQKMRLEDINFDVYKAD